MTTQLFPPLDAATEAALRASIERFGVLVPVVKNQHGQILDGHHRTRLAVELGVRLPVKTVETEDDWEVREIARTLNEDRRHLPHEQRREIVTALREEGHSFRAIGGALGISQTQAKKDADSGVNGFTPERVEGQDGKSYPATKKPAAKPQTRRTYRKNRDARFEVTNERAQQVANANRKRLIEGISQINGLLRGLMDLDYGIVVAAMDAEEARVWAAKAAEQSRSLKTIEHKLKEAAAHGS